MANTLANLARMYTETTGTGTLTLTTAVPSFLSFDAAGVANGATVTYAIYCGPHREIGAGVYTASGLTLTRATVYSSTNGGSKINLTGRSEVFITAAKEDFTSLALGNDGDYGSTGIITGGALSIGTGGAGVATTFTIAAGTGIVVDPTTNPPTVTAVTWAAQTDVAVTNIATQLVTFVAIDSSGNVQQQATLWTPQDARDYIIIGVVVHSNQTVVNAVNQSQAPLQSLSNQYVDLTLSIGTFNIEGNVFSANGANLKLNKSAGKVFRQGANYTSLSDNPHVVTLASLSQASLRMQNQTGAGSASTTDIDPSNYDVAGVTTAVPANKFSVLRIFSFVSNLVAVQRGQAVYNSLAEAKAAIQTEPYVYNDILLANGILRGFLVVRTGTTNLTTATDAFFIEAGKFGGSAGVGGLSVSTLQNAYDNSADPEILTDATRGALSIKRGSAADTDAVLSVLDGSNTVNFSVTGAGALNSVSISENGTALASKYQGLDADLTSIAALTTAAYGRSLLETTSEANFKATVNLEIGTDVQAYDAELAAIAGLTSAADRLPYFTGSGTAALATFTTAGRNLVDDADASAQRTTLGLGSAAVANIGSSGNNVPFLDGDNTWSGSRNSFGYSAASGAPLEASLDTDFGAPFTMLSQQGSANPGPNFLFRRLSPSPAINDQGGRFLWQNYDDAVTPNIVTLGTVGIRQTAVATTACSGVIRMQTMQAGSIGERAILGAGFYVGSPTGLDKGAGTINASAVYDDSALLCAPVEFMKSSTVNAATWDTLAIDVVEPEEENIEPVYIDVHLTEPEVVKVHKRDGTIQQKRVFTKKATPLEMVPVLDEGGKEIGVEWVPQMRKVIKPAKTTKRRNELAHEFKAMLDEGFDPRDPKAYFDKMLADEALPGLKTKANWVPNEESNAKRTNRIILALELQTAAFKTVYEQVEALKAEVESLKKASR